METVAILSTLLFCVVTPIALVIGLIVWLVRYLTRTSPASPAVAPPPTEREILDAVERLLERWASQGRLPPENRAQLQALLEADRQALQGQVTAPDVAPVQAALSLQNPQIARVDVDQEPVTSALSAPSMDQAAQTAVAPAAASASVSSIQIAPPPLAGRDTVVANGGAPAWGERLWDGLMSLRTRQTLLFLGAFLLVVSALVLVVFNWNTFPPILQFALLAGVCGSLWGAGTWMTRIAGLERAGAGLQAVGGALTPVVAFSLSRPGLLELAPREAWLLASALSLPVYALAAWRLRHVLFAIAGCLAAASAVLAALGFVENQWLALALVLTLTCYLPLAAWLRGQAGDLAAGPYWVAHAGLPATLLVSLLLNNNGSMSAGALAAALWAGAAFYLLATVLDRRPRWSWAAAALAPIALLVSLTALDVREPWWGVAPAIVALAYLGLALAIERRSPLYALPCYASAAVLGLLALAPTIESAETARWTLPLLLVGSLAIALACHRGGLAWLAEAQRLALATFGLALASPLLPAWGAALLQLTTFSNGVRGLALLPLAGLYFAIAYGWPGRLRPSYDLVLQVAGTLLAIGAGGATLLDQRTLDGKISVPAIGMLALTAIWLFQTLLRRRAEWAAAGLGNALLAAALLLSDLRVLRSSDDAIGFGLAFTALYLLGGTLLRGYWTRPGIAWGALAGVGTVLMLANGIEDAGQALPTHALAALALAGLLALVAALWRRAWPGYLVAALLALATLLAASRGFFTAWQPAPGDFGYVLCGLTLGLTLIGQLLRRIEPRYAYPYEVVGFALLTLAPLPTIDSPQHAFLTWAAMTLLYALASWRYRLRWMLAPALLAADMALLQGSAWLSSGGRAADAGRLLLIAAWAQGLIGLWASRRRSASAVQSRIDALQPAYVVASLSGLGALALASGASDVLATIALGLAALLALLGSTHRREEVAWGALAILALGLASLHQFIGLDVRWSMAWGVAEALVLCLVGWAIEPRTENREARTGGSSVDPAGARSRFSLLQVWRQPLLVGPLAAGLVLVGGLLLVPGGSHLSPLTFGLATLSLLLTTIAVRRRRIEYAYGAAAALIAAGMCQLYDWGFRQPQWYVVPAGLYLLALAEGLRRFQGQRKLSQLTEAGATMLLLGVTLGQSLRAEGIASQGYAVVLCVEALALLGYGTLRKLRVPFFGGALFFVIGVLWLSVDPLLSANKWVLLGILGLLLVGAYVLLERRQEQLARAGRAWVERVSGWG